MLGAVRAQRSSLTFPPWLDVNDEINAGLVRQVWYEGQLVQRHWSGPKQTLHQVRWSCFREPARIRRRSNRVGSESADGYVVCIRWLRSVKVMTI